MIKKIIIILLISLLQSQTTSANSSSIKPIFLYNNQENTPQENIATDEVNTAIFHFTINHIDLQTATTQLNALFPKLKIIPLNNHQLISVKTSSQTAQKITKILKKWDTPPIQIRFYTHIYEIATDSLKKSQNLLSGLSAPFTMEYNIIENKLSSLSPLITHLQQLESNGEATLIAHPMVATTLQKEAEIRIGDKIPYESTASNGNLLSASITQMDTGLHIKIKPTQINNTAIHSQVNIKIETIKVWKQLNTTKFPILSKRWVKTTVSLTHKQPFIIAGLTQENKKNNHTHPSLFNKIPILKDIASKKEITTTKTDLVIIIIPEIILPSQNSSLLN